jgi:hypothetical protein
MTQLLKKAIAELTKLSELDQNKIARWLLEELISEKEWDHKFAESEDLLSDLADEALEEHSLKKTKILDLDNL